MPIFTKNNVPVTELSNLNESFKKALELVEKSSDSEEKLGLCKEIMEDYIKSMRSMNNMELYATASKDTKKILFKSIFNELQSQYIVAKNIYVVEQKQALANQHGNSTEEFIAQASEEIQEDIEEGKQEAALKEHKLKFSSIAAEVAQKAKTINLSKDILSEFLNAANENDSKTSGRAYFLDFIAANKAHFDVLIANLPEDKKTKFMDDIKPVFQLTTTASAKSALLNVMSWVATPLTVLARTIAPSAIEQVSSVMPATQDSYCKSQLKQLISETLEHMQHIEDTEEYKQTFSLIAATAAQQAVMQVAVRQEFKQKYSPIAIEVAQKAIKQATAKQEHKQKFPPIAAEAAQEAVRRATAQAEMNQAAALKEHKHKFSPIVAEVAQKAKAVHLNKDILTEFLKAANENDSKTTGRVYFLDFIGANKAHFDVLMANLPEDKKTKFMDDIKPVLQPTSTARVKSAALNVMSWVATPLTVLVRKMAPSAIEQVSSLMPATQDSYCKSQLKQLISETLDDLHKQEHKQKFPVIATEAAQEAIKQAAAKLEHKQKFPPIAAAAAQEAVRQATAQAEMKQATALKEHKHKFSPIVAEAVQKAKTINLNKDILSEFLKAANENDSKTTGRAYFLDFISANKAHFDVLMANLPEDKKTKFMDDIKPVLQPTSTARVKSAALNVMSWVATPLTVLVRKMAPSAIEQVSSLMPATQDSYCKSQLKQLIAEALDNLQLIEHQEEFKQKFVPIATAAAQKAVQPTAKQEYQQNFSPIVAAAAQAAVRKATLQEEQKQRFIQIQIATEAAQEKVRLEVAQEVIQIPLTAEIEVGRKHLIRLEEQKAEFLEFLEQFRLIAMELNNKQKANKKYTQVAKVAGEVWTNLDTAARFFEAPTAESFASFKELCRDNINQAAKEFKQHRDLWPTMNPILKGILGVLAALTIVPALIITAATKEGYITTFFKPAPETKSFIELNEISKTLGSVDEEIEHKMALSRIMGA